MPAAVWSVRRYLAVGWACCWLQAVCAGAGSDAGYQAALESISASQLQQYVKFLAADALEGRESGSRGGRTAGDYLRDQLAKLALKPAGIDAGFFQPFAPNYRNVLAILPGRDPVLRDQLVIVSAHYDHVGYGRASNSRGPIGYIHPGADDNASGVSGVLELAEAFTLLSEPTRRSLLFALWDAEEKGMLGSAYWVSHTTLPGKAVAALVNLDMIGSLRSDQLTVIGSRSAYGWRKLLSQENAAAWLRLDFPWKIEANSDHYTFFDRRMPALLVNTGLTNDYHSPRDRASLINHSGMSRVVRFTFAVVFELANRAEPLVYREAGRGETDEVLRESAVQPAGWTDRLGATWTGQSRAGEGVRLRGVMWGSPAQQAGLRAGDQVLAFAGRDIHSADELTGAVAGAESPATAMIRRINEREPRQVTILLRGSPKRLGIAWRRDDAEPGTVVLTHVVAGSPGARAGLRPGDRIYQVAGRDFTEDALLTGRDWTGTESLELTIEREGRVQTVVVRLEVAAPKRAA